MFWGKKNKTKGFLRKDNLIQLSGCPESVDYNSLGFRDPKNFE
jgi:hypothetical protein